MGIYAYCLISASTAETEEGMSLKVCICTLEGNENGS